MSNILRMWSHKRSSDHPMAARPHCVDWQVTLCFARACGLSRRKSRTDVGDRSSVANNSGSKFGAGVLSAVAMCVES